MDWRLPSLPPLLRGLGTLLVVVASVVVGVAEHRQAVQMQADIAEARERVEAEAGAALADRRTEALTREIQRLRLQVQEHGLAGEVFENPWFQVLGVLGTLLIAASFFLEAWQKRSDSAAGPGDPS